MLREFLAILNEEKLEETIQEINAYYIVHIFFIYLEKNIKKPSSCSSDSGLSVLVG